jgi:ribosome maturation factor RimP
MVSAKLQRMEATVDELERLAARVALEAGVELVELCVRGSGPARVLRVDIDRAGERGVDLADCQRVSRALGAALDESELIPTSYQLEVSSPGIDRPIRSADDIRRNTGRLVCVIVEGERGARRSERGRLVGADDEFLILEDAGGKPLRIARREIVKAKQDLPF